MPYNHALAWLEKKAESAAPKPIEQTRIALISDIHSNIEALEAVLKDIENRAIKRIFCAGDIVGYGADPDRVCQIVKDIPSVAGNHDVNLDFHRIEWFNFQAQLALKWTASHINTMYKAWLLTLPQSIVQNVAKKKIVLVHGTPQDPLYGYAMPNTDREILRKWINQSGADILVTGHTHIPFTKKIFKKLFINAGSVGQPRDGNPKACWIELDVKSMAVTIHRVSYNIDQAANKILKQGLPKILAERLYEGL
jgi:putative phosphoesterase